MYYNPREIEFCGVDKYHAAGLRGRGIKVGVIEGGMSKFALDHLYNGKVHDPFGLCVDRKALYNNHMQNVVSVVHEILPEADIYLLPRAYDPDEPEKGYVEGIRFAIENELDFLNASYSGTGDTIRIKKDIEEKAFERGIRMFCAAGNKGDKHINPNANTSRWYGVGNCYLNKSGEVGLHYKSSIGDGVAISGFGVLTVPNILNDRTPVKTAVGTSFASPWCMGLAGLLKEYYMRIIEVDGDMAVTEALTDLFSNAIDLGEEGKDIYTGVGIAVLPELKKSSKPKKRTVKLRTPVKIENGRFLVPARELVEELEGIGIWNTDNPSQGVFIFGDKTIIMTDGRDEIEIIEG